MLGAQLDDLDALASRLRITSTEIGDSHARATATTGRVVSEVRQSAGAALSDIAAAMTTLRAAVSASATSASTTTWSGLNHDRFLDAHRDFDHAMVRAEETTTSAFADFRTSIDQMAAGIEDYTTTLASSLERAAEAAASMAAAVEHQRANLDQVMNQGLGLG